MPVIKFLGLVFFLMSFGSFAWAEGLPTVVRENFKMVLSATQQGPIQLYVEQGDVVSKGDKLFGMDMEEVQLKVKLAQVQWEQAQASEKKARNPHTAKKLRHAKLKFEQQDSLYRSGGLSPDAYEIAKMEYELTIQNTRDEDISIAQANVKVRRYQLELAETALKKATSVTAADGRIHILIVQPNEWVRPGQEILVLININPVKVVVNVPLRQINKVTPDKPLKVLISTGLKQLEAQGVVKHISDEVDAVSQTVPVRLEINNEKNLLKPGMRAQVLLP